jgi:hypothetical protein
MKVQILIVNQIFLYDGVHLLGENITIIKKNTEGSLDASKEIGLEVNTEKTNHIFMSHHQTTGQNHYIKVTNKSFENVAFKIFRKNSNKSKLHS